ncbi:MULTISPECIES: hypothetical protein [unclassified Limnothrix]|nr:MULTISPECIES: hypothetical protein [unclassified Limnothrix]
MPSLKGNFSNGDLAGFISERRYLGTILGTDPQARSALFPFGPDH